MSNSTIYIIILNWNGLADTEECLRSLHIAAPEAHIVIVENGSGNDEAGTLLKEFPYIHLIRNGRNEGFCRGNNQGIEYCLSQPNCQYIMLLNNDTTVQKDFLHPLISYIEQNSGSVVSPKVLYYGKNIVQNMGGKLFFGGTINIGKNRPSGKYTVPLQPDFLVGTAMIAERSAWERVGLLDDDYFAYGEDLDWSWRARRKGYKLVVVPKSIIYHRHSRSTKRNYNKVYLITRNNIYFAKKNYSALSRNFFILGSLVTSLIVNLWLHKDLKVIKYWGLALGAGLRFRPGKN